jgi:hypothetical protein
VGAVGRGEGYGKPKLESAGGAVEEERGLKLRNS